MKKVIFILSFFVLVANTLKAQVWSELGQLNSISENEFAANTICIDASNNIYAAIFSDQKWFVAKWNGNNWKNICEPNFDFGRYGISAICCDKWNNLYVAYSDVDYYHMKKWNGKEWRQLPDIKIIKQNWNNGIFGICTDFTGILYAAGSFVDATNKCFVAKWDGRKWSKVYGSELLTGDNFFNSICVDKLGVIYATVCHRSSKMNGTYVVKLDNGIWVDYKNEMTLKFPAVINTIYRDFRNQIWIAGELPKMKFKKFLAKWNDKKWIEIPNYQNDSSQNYIGSVCADTSGNLYAAGSFKNRQNQFFIAQYSLKEKAKIADSITFPEIYFKTNSATIDDAFYIELNKVVEKLSKTNFSSIEVVGYTDNQGTDELNKKLSEQRAESIAAYFESKEIAKEKILVEGLGAANPVADNSTDEGRKRNRRVVIYILRK